MEGYMSRRKVTHEIKLPLSLTIILCVIAFRLVANVFKPVLNIEEASAATSGLTKKDIKDVLNKCNFRIHGQPVAMPWQPPL
jgi:uncharacterized ion transporter superfamily protein YfcC